MMILTLLFTAASGTDLNVLNKSSTKCTIVKDRAFKGSGDVFLPSAVSWQNCAGSCHANQKCKVWAYKTKGGYCFGSSERKNVDQGSFDPYLSGYGDGGVFTTEYECEETDPLHFCTVVKDRSFQGSGQFDPYEVSDWKKCAVDCHNTEGCYSWTFQSENKKCYMSEHMTTGDPYYKEVSGYSSGYADSRVFATVGQCVTDKKFVTTTTTTTTKPTTTKKVLRTTTPTTTGCVNRPSLWKDQVTLEYWMNNPSCDQTSEHHFGCGKNNTGYFFHRNENVPFYCICPETCGACNDDGNGYFDQCPSWVKNMPVE